MKPLYKILTFQALVAGYCLLLVGNFGSAPFVYGRLLGMFIFGAVLALFVEGPPIGALPPNSTRPGMVVLGVLLMGASLVWTLAIRRHI
jgi:hypothetical protein